MFGYKSKKQDDPLAVTYIPVAELIPYALNARTHSDEQVEILCGLLREFGWTNPVLTNGMGVLAGHGRILAAVKVWDSGESIRRTPDRMVPCIDLTGLSAAQQRAYVLADNQAPMRAGWDADLLGAELRGLKLDGFAVEGLGFELPDLEAMLNPAGAAARLPDSIPPVSAAIVSQPGDIWILGASRVMCGDTTDAEAVKLLVGPHTGLICLIHADPPYGMGKEADGIANDNLYEAKLDAFQLAWWRTWVPHTTGNASAYIWGNPADLWRLWWRGGLAEEPGLLARNEIVWDKGSGFGMTGEGAHSYVVSTERCLFLMRGEQFLGNQNKDQYWEGYEPLRSWLEAERIKAGWTNGQVNKLTKTQMAGHWFTKSQFIPISEAHYLMLQRAAEGMAFVEGYDALFSRLFPDVRAGGNQHRRELAAELRERRSYFDNTHAAMAEVWQFPRVNGAERFGHATPKPVAMVERAMLTSSQRADIVAVPFGGTGPELIAADKLGRCALVMELEPAYVDVMIRRWESFTGRKATLEQSDSGFLTDGPATFEVVAAARRIAVEVAPA